MDKTRFDQCFWLTEYKSRSLGPFLEFNKYIRIADKIQINAMLDYNKGEYKGHKWPDGEAHKALFSRFLWKHHPLGTFSVQLTGTQYLSFYEECM